MNECTAECLSCVLPRVRCRRPAQQGQDLRDLRQFCVPCCKNMQAAMDHCQREALPELALDSHLICFSCAVSKSHTLGGMAVESAEDNHCGIFQSRVEWTGDVEVVRFPGSPAAGLRMPEDSR